MGKDRPWVQIKAEYPHKLLVPMGALLLRFYCIGPLFLLVMLVLNRQIHRIRPVLQKSRKK
jgi:hypothetical protein